MEEVEEKGRERLSLEVRWYKEYPPCLSRISRASAERWHSHDLFDQNEGSSMIRRVIPQSLSSLTNKNNN